MTLPPIFTSPPCPEYPQFASIAMTPRLANHCVQHYPFPRQRELRRWHVEQLAASMQAGTFPPHSLMTFAWYNGTIYCVNGSHRLHAIADSKITIPCTIEMCACGTFEDVCALYRAIDDGLPRNAGDRLRAHGFAQEHNIGERLQQRLKSAVGLIMSGFTDNLNRGSMVARIYRDTARLIPFMADWIPEAREYERLLAGVSQQEKAKFYHVRTMSVALVTLRYVPEHATAFWKKTSHQTGFEEDDPEMALHNWLIHYPADETLKTSQPRYIAAAWNARITEKGDYREEVSCKRLIARPGTLSFQLNGTPFRGKESLWFIDAGGKPVHDPIPKPTPHQVMAREAINTQLETTEEIVDELRLPSIEESDVPF